MLRVFATLTKKVTKEWVYTADKYKLKYHVFGG